MTQNCFGPKIFLGLNILLSQFFWIQNFFVPETIMPKAKFFKKIYYCNLTELVTSVRKLLKGKTIVKEGFIL